MKQPHLLLITTDEQRYDTYGSQPSEWPTTPNLARLREEGVTLENAYSNCPVCMPCRYSWMTGLYACQREGEHGYDWPDYHPMFPQILRRAGYHTALAGKLHAFRGRKGRGSPDPQLFQEVWGFDFHREWAIKSRRYLDQLQARGVCEPFKKDYEEREIHRQAHGGLEPYRPGVQAAQDMLDAVIADDACRFIADYREDKPFFLHASFYAPHYPLGVPSEFFDRFVPEEMPEPRGVEDPGLIRAWQENRAMYMGMISFVDTQIGRLLAALEERGWLDETIILFTTDHGDMLGDFGNYQKRKPQEGSVRTPVLVRYPREMPGGVTRDGLVESIDLPHTLLDMAGLTEEEREAALPCSQGRSFLNYAREGGETFRESALAELGDGHRHSSWRMLRRGDWKYVRWPSQGDLLYDLREDPHELNNRINDPGCDEIRRALQECLLDRMMCITMPPIQGPFRVEPK